MALLRGMKLGPYVIVDLIGAGGMGEVYRARDTSLEREVAVKILHTGALNDPDRLRRFRQEAQSTASLHHPNILAIYFVGEHDGAPFLVSELLAGESLRARIRREALPVRKVLDIALQIIDGLAAAHAKGIVHRDLKPENIFLTEDGHVKILDFGLAKLVAPDGAQSDSTSLNVTAGSLSGVVLGTVGYMSPEQMRGQALDTRSDIFSFGVVLYEMLSGKNVFARNTVADTLSALLREDPPELTQTSKAISPGLDRVVRRCLEKEPPDRFQSVRDLGFALQAVSTGASSDSLAMKSGEAVHGFTWSKRALIALMAILLPVGGFVLGGYFARRSSPGQPEFRQLTFRRGPIRNARFGSDDQTIIYAASLDGAPSRLFATHRDSPESQALEPANISLFAVGSTGELAISLGCSIYTNAQCSGTVARMPLSGGAPRPVAPDVIAADWLPDGKELAIVRRRRGHFLVEFPIGKVIYSTPGWISAMRVSPDGKYLAIADNPSPGNDAGNIVIMDALGKHVVTAGPWNSIQGVAWTSSGAEVWFGASSGNEAFADQIRAVDLSGHQRMILRLPGIIRLHDISRDGRVLITKEEWRALMPFRGPNDVKERDLSWLDLSTVSDLARDAQSVIFSEVGQAPLQDYFIYQRKTDGSPAVKLGDGLISAISPDGMWVLSEGGQDPQHPVLLPTGPGETRTLSTPGLTQFGAPSWTPDSKMVVYEATDGHAWRMYLQDLVGGAPKPITPELSGPYYQEAQFVSPDGKSVFGRDLENKAKAYPLNGSQEIEIPGLQVEESFAGWAADSRSVYVFRSDAYPVHLFKVDISTGTRKIIREIMPEDPVGLDSVFSVRISRDEKSCVYSYQRSLSELYLATGLR